MKNRVAFFNFFVFLLSAVLILVSVSSVQAKESSSLQEKKAISLAEVPTSVDDQTYEEATVVKDPLEKMNRAVFSFNRGVDKVIIRPVTKVYDFLMPNFAQKGVDNFFTNIGTIPSIANDILQGNLERTVADTWRLLINSTVGLLGFIDVASRLGLDRTNNDFQLTLAKWGVKNTPYFVIPILGPSTIGDTVGLFANYEFLTIWPHVEPKRDRYELLALNMIRVRANLLKGDKVIEEAFDPYVLVRSAYMQHREYLLKKVSSKYLAYNGEENNIYADKKNASFQQQESSYLDKGAKNKKEAFAKS